MKIIKKFRKSEKGSITVMVLAAMLFLIGVITVSYFAMSNKSIEQNKKVSQIAKQYKTSDEDMEKEYQKAINNLKVEDYVKVGDYVDYNPTIASKDGTKVEESKLSYTSPTGTASEHGNGYSEQTFKATEDTKWRVLSIENGTVKIISEDVIKTESNENFILSGAIGYLYAEQELNEACKIFGYGYGADTTKGGNYTVGGPLDTPVTGKIEGTGARSIAIEDINKIIGAYEKNGKMQYSDGRTVFLSYGDSTNPTSNVYYPTIKTDTGKSDSVGVKELKVTYYAYNKTIILDNSIADMLFIDNNDYWLSSRCVNTAYTFASFYVRSIKASRDITANRLCHGVESTLGETQSRDCSIRPIVSIKSNVINMNINYDLEGKWKLK